MNYEQSNVGPGMAPHKNNCQCDECIIERLQSRARIAEQERADLAEALDATVIWAGFGVGFGVLGGQIFRVSRKSLILRGKKFGSAS